MRGTMSQVLYFPSVRQHRLRDDLAMARGVAIAVVVGSAFWGAAFVIAEWLFG
jgi:hypothetical protein